MIARRAVVPAVALFALAAGACTTAGSSWMSEPMSANDEEKTAAGGVSAPEEAPESADPARFRTRRIGGEDEVVPPRTATTGGAPPSSPAVLAGKVLGTFRNTYYDFPSEPDFTGDAASLFDAECHPIAQVPRGFHDAVCVQGSGILKSGKPVSFARRDCECAEVCPRTGQKICFEALDPASYPWGRGALGKPITPLSTVAVDDSIVPMGTPVYVPEFEGLPLDSARSAAHDGCFVAEDRGLRVKGQHLDVFTGSSEMTKLWNQLVPSNHGITVVVDSPHCVRTEVRAGPEEGPVNRRRSRSRSEKPAAAAK